MKLQNLSFYLLILLVITTIYQCKQSNTVAEFPIQWEYAKSNQLDSINEIADNAFLPLDNSILHSLSSLVESEKGYIWVRGKFSYKPNTGSTSISLGKIIWAEDTYINNELIGSTIRNTPEQWNFWNYYRNYSIHSQLLKVDEENVIMIRLYVNGEGSLPESISIGDTEDINLLTFKSMFYESYINGVVGFLFFVISLYHLLIYIKRRKDKENLYYAIFCFSYSIYSLNFISWIFESFFTFKYVNFQKLIFISMFVLLYSFYKFISVFLKRNDKRWVKYSFIVLAVVPSLLVIFSPNYIFMYKIRNTTTLMTIPFVFYIIFVPIYNFFKYKNPEAKAMLVSLLILLATVFHDMLNVIFKLEQPFLVGLGIPAFMGSIMFLLGSKFVEVHNQTDELNETLESKVVERTKEVMEKMEVIKALNIQQDGDYYLTSLIEKPLGTNYNKSKVIKTEFYIEQKKKFQFRSKNSELGGDICISGNLRFGDGKNRFVFFFNGDAMGKSMQGAGGAIVAGTVVNNILARSARNNRVLRISPREWITETYYELDSVFKTFDGSMLMSCACGLIDEKTGKMLYFNAEHPWSVLYRDGKAEFIESALVLRKLGTYLEGNVFEVQEFQFEKGDVFFTGSDGRDDLDISLSGERNINEDETRFLSAIEKSKGDLSRLAEEIHKIGKVTDDLSLIRIYIADNLVIETNEFDILSESKRLIESGFESEGIGQIMEHLNSNPDDLSAIEFLSNYYYNLKDYAKATLYMERILSFRPDDLDVIFNLSICYKHLKEYELAIHYAEKLFHLNPRKISNIINLADNYRLTGNFEKARECLNRAIDSIHYFENAIKLDKILKSKGF